MIKKTKVIHPINEIIESFPDNMQLLYRIGNDWHYFVDNEIIHKFQELTNLFNGFPHLTRDGYYLLVSEDQDTDSIALQAFYVGSIRELVDGWIKHTDQVIVTHPDLGGCTIDFLRRSFERSLSKSIK